MKIGARGQVTIPQRLRQRLGMTPRTEVEFVVVRGELVLRKTSPSPVPAVRKWTGFLRGQPADVDEFIEEIRGR